MAEPEDMIVPLLREMRSEIASSRAELAAFRKETGERFTGIEAGQRNLRHAMAGARIELLQARITELESRS